MTWSLMRLLLLTLLNATDATLTTLCIGSGVGYEANPVMAFAIAKLGIAMAMALKMAVVPGAGYLIEMMPPISIGFGRTVPAGMLTAFLIGLYIAVCGWGALLYMAGT